MPDNRKPLIYGAFPVCRNYTVRAHFRHPGPAKRGRRENRLLRPGPLQRRVYPGHLRSRHHHSPAGGSEEDGWGAGAEDAVRKIPGAGMRWYPLQSLTQTQGKTVWVRYGSGRKTTPEPRSSGVVLCCPFWRKNSADCTAITEMKTVAIGNVRQKYKRKPQVTKPGVFGCGGRI